jgi:hypothetical protein
MSTRRSRLSQCPEAAELSATDWNPADATALAAAVESGRLMADLHEFARRVKLSGTPQELESFRAAIRAAAAAGDNRAMSVKWSKLDLTPTFAPGE